MKKLTTLVLVAIVACSSTILVSCKKYEEGPSISLRSKTARVSNQWKVQYAKDLQDGVETTADHAGDIWEFTKNGDFLKNGTKRGTWEFSDSKEQIVITNSLGEIDFYTILKLKENEMWIQEPGDEEIHLVTL